MANASQIRRQFCNWLQDNQHTTNGELQHLLELCRVNFNADKADAGVGGVGAHEKEDRSLPEVIEHLRRGTYLSHTEIPLLMRFLKWRRPVWVFTGTGTDKFDGEGEPLVLNYRAQAQGAAAHWQVLIRPTGAPAQSPQLDLAADGDDLLHELNRASDTPSPAPEDVPNDSEQLQRGRERTPGPSYPLCRSTSAPASGSRSAKSSSGIPTVGNPSPPADSLLSLFRLTPTASPRGPGASRETDTTRVNTGGAPRSKPASRQSPAPGVLRRSGRLAGLA